MKHDMKVGEVVVIGGVKVTVQRKTGQRVTLLIDAPTDVVITTEKSQRKTQEAEAHQNAI